MTSKYNDFTPQEVMAVAAAREIKDGEKVIVGTGLPLLGAFLAQKTHAPNIIAVYESGAIDCKPLVTPFSVADSVLVPGSAMQGGLMEGLGIVHAGDIDVGFLGGGSNDIGSSCKRTIVMMLHQKQRFPRKVDFLTTPGYFGGGREREAYGFVGGGPSVVISTLGILRFDPDTKEMYLASYHPGATIEQIQENTGWNLKIADDVHETERPDPELIRILREECDPQGIFLKKQ
jgi:glutaconate CoA-transferase subunit B